MQTENKPVVSDRANNTVTGRKPDRPQFASEFVSEHDTEIALEREYFIVQHNDMVQKQRFALGKNAGNSLSVTEEKVLAYLISKIKPESTLLRIMTILFPLWKPDSTSNSSWQTAMIFVISAQS